MTMEQAAMKHASEIRRCLLTCDLEGMIKVWREIAPHLVDENPANMLVSLHMARVDASTIPLKHRQYSVDWLHERGFKKIDGKWQHGKPKHTEVVEAAAIASRSSIPGVSKRITQAMTDAHMNSLAKGIREPEIQRENILKAREKERFKMKLI